MSRPYSEAIDISPSVSWFPCATYSNEHTGDIITFTLLSETLEDA